MDSEQPTPFRSSQFSYDDIRKLRTFGRAANKSCAPFIRDIIQELYNTPYQEIDHLYDKLKKTFEFAHTFRAPSSLKKLHADLSPKFPEEFFKPLWRNFNLSIGNFLIAVELAHEIWLSNPKDTANFQTLISCCVSAGCPGEAILLLKENFTLFGNTYSARLLNLMLSGGCDDWLATNQCDYYASKAQQIKLLEEYDGHDAPINTYCISLLRDKERLQSTQYFFNSTKIKFHHMIGVEGSKVTEETYFEQFNQDRGFPMCSPGELGCAFSHFNAWKTIADNCNDDEFGLVIEDDSYFSFGDARGLNAAVKLAQAGGFEMVFVNLRACTTLAYATYGAQVSQMSLNDLYKNIEPTGNRRNPGWGTDGYIISGKGARRIVELWKKMGVIGAIDWQLVFMSLDDFNLVPPRPLYRNIMNSIQTYKEQNPDYVPINSAVMSIPIIFTVENGYSTIEQR